MRLAREVCDDPRLDIKLAEEATDSQHYKSVREAVRVTRLIVNYENDALASRLWSAQLIADSGIGGTGKGLLASCLR